MQIQRIQSIYLLLAFICALCSWFFPWVKFEAASINLYPYTNIFLGILAALATILPLIAIFMYRNMRRQKLMCGLGAFMVLFSLGYVVALTLLGADADGVISVGAPVAMGASGILDILARRAIISDENLLKSADRIR